MRGRKKKVIQEQSPIDIAMGLIKEGYTRQHIKEKLAEMSGGKHTDEELDSLVSEAFTTIAEDYISDPNSIIKQHVKRYDKIIDRCLKTVDYDEALIDAPISVGGITAKKWLTARQDRIKAYLDCITSLSQKETLLSLSFERVTAVDINEKINVNVNGNRQLPYNLSKLKLEQRVRLVDLLKKSRGGQSNVLSVSERAGNETSVTEAVVSAVLPPNIDQIKQIAEPLRVEQHQSHADRLQAIKDRLRQNAANRIK